MTKSEMEKLTGNWNEWAKYVLLSLEEQSEDIKKIQDELTEVKIELREVKTNVAVRSALIGAAIPTLLGLVGLVISLIK